MSDRKHLIDLVQFRELTRPTSIHLDEQEVTAYITECEDAYIIPAIGFFTFKALQESDGNGDYARIMLDGGEWEETQFASDYKRACASDGDENGLHYCNGLRKTLAYYTYAKMLRADGSIISRAGAMRHRDEYGDHIEDSPKLKQYNDVMDMAERYLSEVLLYMKFYTGSSNARRVRGSRARIHCIGD